MGLPISKFKEVKVDNTLSQSDEDAKKASYIADRFQRMYENRSVVDKDWAIYQKMLEAVYREYEDERSSSTVPLAQAILELFIADCVKIPTEYKFRGETTKYTTQAKALEYVWKYDYRKKNRKKEFRMDDYVAAAFGTSVMYV